MLAVLALAVSACAPASTLPPPAPTLAPTETEAPPSTPTPTPAPLTALTLTPILVQPGDLPAGFSAAQVRDAPPGMFDDLPAWGWAVYQQLARGDDTGGGITVISYDDTGALADAYNLVRSGMGDALEMDDLGERAALTMLGFGPGGGDVAFTRCGLLIHIRMVGADRDGLTAYAQRLDKRLQSLPCP